MKNDLLFPMIVQVVISMREIASQPSMKRNSKEISPFEDTNDKLKPSH